jgi:hypothetical protein
LLTTENSWFENYAADKQNALALGGDVCLWIEFLILTAGPAQQWVFSLGPANLRHYNPQRQFEQNQAEQRGTQKKEQASRPPLLCSGQADLRMHSHAAQSLWQTHAPLLSFVDRRN